MNNQKSSNNSEVRAEQVTNEFQYEAIFLGLDLDKKSIVTTRIIDWATPQQGQRLSWDRFMAYAKRQLTLAKKVYAVYEAGAFGFWFARKLKAMGVECFVVHPQKLDPRNKRVQTDKTDSRHLADNLQRYVRGNKKAMAVVYIPSEAEEQQRIESRHRRALAKESIRLQRRGAGLLLSQGIFDNARWWKDKVWAELQERLSPELRHALEDDRALILDLDQRLKIQEKKLEEAAPKKLPHGFGRLTFVLLIREICNYQRFKSRRNVGGFTGLCGAVSSSGDYHLDLSINKAGSSYVRTTLVELAWRMIYWQPQYTGLKAWKSMVQSGVPVGKRRRKMAVVAVARQLAVDIWKWQTGRVTPEELGWVMKAAA